MAVQLRRRMRRDHYAVLFPRVIVGDGPEFRHGNLLWTVTMSASHVLVASTGVGNL